MIAAAAQLNPRQSHVVQSIIGAGNPPEMLEARRQLSDASPQLHHRVDRSYALDGRARHRCSGWLVDWVRHALAEELHARGALSGPFDRAIIEQLLVAPSQRSMYALPLTREGLLTAFSRLLPQGAVVFVDSLIAARSTAR